MTGPGDHTGPLRLVVADDHPVFLDGLVSVLEERGMQVVAAVGDGDQAIAAVAEHRPDVVLMDLVMPGTSGIDATRRILAEHPRAAILVLTMSEDDHSIFAALRAGAHGYLLKEANADDIARAVATVARGEAVLGASVSTRILDAASHPDGQHRHTVFPQLTDREREVLVLVAHGCDNARIARTLGLSDKTVRNYVSTILTKLPAASRAEAVAIARDAGLGQAR